MAATEPHERRTGDLAERLPWWGSLLLGMLAIVVGVLLATRPLTSLQALALYLGVALMVLGAAELIGDRTPPDTERTTWATVRAVVVMALGLLILLWLRHHFELLALVLAVALVVSGGRRLWQAGGGARLTSIDRVATGLLGAAEVLISVVAVRWPDLTLLALAVLFAVRLVAFGIGRIRRAHDQWRHHSATTPRRRPAASWLRLVGGALALLLALGAGFLGVQARTGSPTVDAFYETPTPVPTQPGVLLRSEPFTRDVPDGATGWRILYTTRTADGSPATASGVVLLPESIDATRPVIAWAHGTTGFATQCAPTLLEHPFEAGAMPALEQVVDRGWALVATDYTGLGTPGPHPYLIGTGEGHSVLDAIRAAGALEDANLAAETVVWGHSQGGHAALWTGQLAGDYAPEIDLVGVVAMAPAADVTALATSLPDVTGGALFASYVIGAYAAHYQDVTLEGQVIPPARTLVREMAGRCLAEPRILASLVSVLSLSRDQSVYSQPPALGALGERLRANVPTGPFPMPVLVAQGEADTLILPTNQQAYVDRLCAAGESLAYRTYPGEDHLSLVAPQSKLIDDLLQWTAARIDGSPGAVPDSRCG